MGLLTRNAARAAPLAVLVALGTTLPAAAAPVSDFEMPFPCGQVWRGTTRASHSPSSKAVDWNRADDDGDPVVAAAPGLVSVADTTPNSGYGKWVMLDHGNGETTIYAHLSAVSVVEGQRVDQGALLGNVGSTGNSSGPHLHFEERKDRKDVDPWFHGVKFVFGTSPTSQNCVDVPLAADLYDGPEAEPVAFHRAAVATFVVTRVGRAPKTLAFGTATDEPVLGDWDGNGKANVGVWSPATKTFQLRTPAGVLRIGYGASSDRPVAGDWNGDGRWDVGVRRSSTASFHLRSSTGQTRTVTLGDADDLPVTGDWDGDGVTDLGVYDQATAAYTLRLLDESGLEWIAHATVGVPGSLPVVGDWDGNHKSDLGAWNPATAVLTQRRAPSPTTAKSVTTTVVLGHRR